MQTMPKTKRGRARDGAPVTIGGTAAALLVSLLALAACSSAPTPAPATPQSVEPPLAAGSGAAVEIHSLDLAEQATGSLVEVETSGSLVWTTYRDVEGNLVVELPNSSAQEIGGIERDSGLVASVDVQVEETGERPLTRLVVRTRAEAEHSVVAEGSTLRVELVPLDADWLASAPAAPAETAPAPRVAEEALEEAPATAEDWIETEDAELVRASEDVATAAAVSGPAPALRGVPATQLQNVEVVSEAGGTLVRVVGDGEFYYSTFELDAPQRFVVDLIGVVNMAPLSSIEVASELVDRVRVAQFKPQPEMVARVVVDLNAPSAAQVEQLPDGLAIAFGGVAHTTLMEDASSAVAGVEEPEPAVAEPMPAEETVVAEEAPAWETYETEESYAAEETYAAAEEPQSWQEPAAEVADEGMGSIENGSVGTHDLSAVATTATVAQADPVEEVEAPVYQPSAALPSQPSATGSAAKPAAAPARASSFESQAIGSAQKTYQGEPMTMSLKNADIKDVLRSFAQISGLNVVVQPSVAGTVTVELTDVPWDQALEQILKINGLNYQLEGNIMRVAPIAQLRAEAEEQQKLLAAQSLSIPLSTIMKRVSYASAAQIAELLKGRGGASIMSQRGSVVVDTRTNTLIIKELPSFMDAVISVIENLDTPEPQVMIEARIIETTKRFANSLGIQWGFQGLADPEHGNTTGLEFPNNGAVDGSVSLLTGGANGLLDITLGNVLNTFRLDALLAAAESDGLINILSAPRITTLNNERASIQSGLQIPIQTVANNTVSVQFVNATLRLDVTPHVTAEGTVLMDISIQKREPQLAFAVVGATNAPISTKDASTRVIVRDGGTTVIGGIYKVTSDEGEDRVPGLANVPVIKHLFKNKRRNDENEELLIFITPRVVKL